MNNPLKINDQVSFLDSDEKGKIISILSEDTYLLLLDNGMDVKVHYKEIVKIGSRSEGKIIDQINEAKPILKPILENGIKLQFKLILDGSKSLNGLSIVLNKQELGHLNLILIKESNNLKYCIYSGSIIDNSAIQLNQIESKDLDSQYCFLAKGYYFNSKNSTLNHIDKTFKIKVSNLLKQPNYQSEIVLFEEDRKITNGINKTISPKPELKADFIIKNSTDFFVPLEVDLHLEKIVPKEQIKKHQPVALETQMRHFEHYLQIAYITHKERVVFIHGVGDGILKQRILTYLSSSPIVQLHKPADVHKYGGGATEVFLKNV
jgi:hypothetical protein